MSLAQNTKDGGFKDLSSVKENRIVNIGQTHFRIARNQRKTRYHNKSSCLAKILDHLNFYKIEEYRGTMACLESFISTNQYYHEDNNQIVARGNRLLGRSSVKICMINYHNDCDNDFFPKSFRIRLKLSHVNGKVDLTGKSMVTDIMTLIIQRSGQSGAIQSFSVALRGDKEDKYYGYLHKFLLACHMKFTKSYKKTTDIINSESGSNDNLCRGQLYKYQLNDIGAGKLKVENKITKKMESKAEIDSLYIVVSLLISLRKMQPALNDLSKTTNKVGKIFHCFFAMPKIKNYLEQYFIFIIDLFCENECGGRQKGCTDIYTLISKFLPYHQLITQRLMAGNIELKHLKVANKRKLDNLPDSWGAGFFHDIPELPLPLKQPQRAKCCIM